MTKHESWMETTEDQLAEVEVGPTHWSDFIDGWLDTWTDDMRATVYRHTKPVEIWPRLLELMGCKEAKYDLSWAKRGVLGYWHGCIARQQDRVDPGFRKLVSQSSEFADSPMTKRTAKSLIGTLADVANYAIMGICMLASMYPVEYDAWVEEIGQED